METSNQSTRLKSIRRFLASRSPEFEDAIIKVRLYRERRSQLTNPHASVGAVWRDLLHPAAFTPYRSNVILHYQFLSLPGHRRLLHTV